MTFQVFEASSGTCVLLPTVGNGELLKTPNEYTVSGSISIEIVTAASLRRGDCTFEQESGYSSGQIGAAEPLPGAKPITTPQDCCDACDKTPDCAKFTFEAYSKACMMYAAYSEKYLTAALSSGAVSGRTSSDIAASGGGNARGPGGGTMGATQATTPKPWLDEVSPPPAPPAFTLVFVRPPPPPPPGDVASTKNLMTGFSIGAFALMMSGFVLCAFCFFGAQLSNLVWRATGGRYGRRHTGMQKLYTSDWDEKVALAAAARPQRELGKKKKGRTQQAKAGHVSVTVETAAMTQKKELCVEGVVQYAQLLALIFDEFGPLLKGRSSREMILLCYGKSSQLMRRASESDEDEREVRYSWLLVVPLSDTRKMLASCSALKLTEKAEGHRDDDFQRAFVPEDNEGEGQRRQGKKGKRGKECLSKKGTRRDARDLDNDDDEQPKRHDHRRTKTPEENLADALKNPALESPRSGGDKGIDHEERDDSDDDNDEGRWGSGGRGRREEEEEDDDDDLDDGPAFGRAALGRNSHGARRRPVQYIDNDEAIDFADEREPPPETSPKLAPRVVHHASRRNDQQSTAKSTSSAKRAPQRATQLPPPPEPQEDWGVASHAVDRCSDEDDDDAPGPMAGFSDKFNPKRCTAARFNEDDGLSVIGAMHAAQRQSQQSLNGGSGRLLD